MGRWHLGAADGLGAWLVERVVAWRGLRRRVFGGGWNTQARFDLLELLTLLRAEEAEVADLLEAAGGGHAVESDG